MNIEIPGPQAAGFFKLHKFQLSPQGEMINEQLIDFPNLITDVGLAGQMTTGLGSYLSSSSGYLLSFALVGNGNAAEPTSSTSLSSYLAGTNAVLAGAFSTSSTAPYIDSYTVVKRFSPGFLSSSTNVNITEVGMGSGDNTGILFTRSLIKDSGGSPVSMTITPIDYLDIYYTLKLYKYNGPDITGQVSVAGVQTDFVLRSAEITASQFNRSDTAGAGAQNQSYSAGYCNVYESTSTLGAVTGIPSGTSDGTDTYTNNTYISGYARTITCSFSISQGNMSGGIKCALFRTTRGNFQASFNPVIPKNNTKTLSFTITLGPISRYTP